MKVNEINVLYYKILIGVMTIQLILPNFVKYCKILSITEKDQKILLNLFLFFFFPQKKNKFYFFEIEKFF